MIFCTLIEELYNNGRGIRKPAKSYSRLAQFKIIIRKNLNQFVIHSLLYLAFAFVALSPDPFEVRYKGTRPFFSTGYNMVRNSWRFNWRTVHFPWGTVIKYSSVYMPRGIENADPEARYNRYWLLNKPAPYPET